jgi:hypothetical protein
MPESIADQAHTLLMQQRSDWDLAGSNYAALAAVRTRAFEIDGCTIKVQFNPARITSSAAKVDAQSIRQRPCFLCPANLPPQQRALPWSDYAILVNPFPIFPEHFTIASREHRQQQILDSFPGMLELARALHPRYTVFYNGPRCGASAPDHLHFQAGTKGFMPIDMEYPLMRKSMVIDRGDLRIYRTEGQFRPFIGLESGDAATMQRALEVLYRALPGDDEPMLNILCSFERDHWRTILFPRAKHRPSFFFAEGPEKILLSPAAVDLGGVCITPMEHDFDRLTKEHLIGMFSEICLSPGDVNELAGRLKDQLT